MHQRRLPSGLTRDWSSLRPLPFLLLFAASSLALVTSCKRAGDDCAIGAEGCACTTGGACNPGLGCYSHLCVRAPNPDGGIGSLGTTTGGTSSQCGFVVAPEYIADAPPNAPAGVKTGFRLTMKDGALLNLDGSTCTVDTGRSPVPGPCTDYYLCGGCAVSVSKGDVLLLSGVAPASQCARYATTYSLAFTCSDEGWVCGSLSDGLSCGSCQGTGTCDTSSHTCQGGAASGSSGSACSDCEDACAYVVCSCCAECGDFCFDPYEPR